MIDKQFEDILKRKLNNMTDYSNIDWSVFEHKLDKAQMSNTASEGDFDSSIKQKLTGITTASLGSDWSIFEQMLNEDQFTDDMLDDKVSEEMNKMRAPYRHDHWEMLHKSLEFKRQRNNNIIGFKVIELSLLFMLLLSANNLYKYLPSTFEVEKPMIYASLDDNIQNSTREPVSETLKTKAITQKKSIVSSSVSRATNKEIITTPTTVKNTNLITTITSASENNNSEVTLTTPLSSYILVSPITDVTSDVEASQKAYILSKASGLINVAAISMREMSNLSSDQPYIHKSIDIALSLIHI